MENNQPKLNTAEDFTTKIVGEKIEKNLPSVLLQAMAPKKPGKLVIKIGNNDSDKESDNEDKSISLEDQRLAQKTIDQAAKLVAPSGYAPPSYSTTPIVYNAPSYPGPPSFNPTIVPSTTMPSTSTAGLTPPTFTYQSAYTGETMKFDGKAYGTPEYAQVPNFKGPGDQQNNEGESQEELKLDIEMTSLRAELQSFEQEVSGFTTLQERYKTKKESMSELENSNRQFFWDQEHLKMQADLTSMRDESITVKKQIKKSELMLRTNQDRVNQESQKMQEIQKEIDLEKEKQQEINSQHENYMASLTTVKRNLDQEREEQQTDKQKASESTKTNSTNSSNDVIKEQQIKGLQIELISQTSHADRLQQSHDQLEQKHKDQFKQLETEEENLYESIEWAHRQIEEHTELQTKLKKTNSQLQSRRYRLKEINSHKETTLSFSEIYLSECEQSVQESTDEHTALKNIALIYQQLLDLQKGDQGDLLFESDSLSKLAEQKTTIDIELSKINDLNADQEKALLLYNTSMPESGVLVKQLNAEIYQFKVGRQTDEQQEDILREKAVKLKALLDDENSRLDSMKSEHEDSMGKLINQIDLNHQQAVENHTNTTIELQNEQSELPDLQNEVNLAVLELKQTQQAKIEIAQRQKEILDSKGLQESKLKRSSDYLIEIGKLCDNARQEADVAKVIGTLQNKLNKLSFSFGDAVEQEIISQQTVNQEKAELNSKLQEFQISLQEQDVKDVQQRQLNTATESELKSTNGQIEELVFAREQSQNQQETSQSKLQTLRDSLQDENDQIVLMKSQSEDSLSTFLQQLEEKQIKIDEKHQRTNIQLDETRLELQNYQMFQQQIRQQVEQLTLEQQILASNLKDQTAKSKLLHGQSQFIDDYLVEIKRLLGENEEVSVNQRAGRLIQIQKIQEEFIAAKEEAERVRQQQDADRIAAEAAEAERIRLDQQNARLAEAERIRLQEETDRLAAEAEADRVRLQEEAERLASEAEAERIRQRELQEQKKIQWVDYSEQESPLPIRDQNELPKFIDTVKLIQIDNTPEDNLRQEQPMRPSIFEMQRKNAQQQSYRATTYDKTKSKRSIIGQGKMTAYTDETVLQDLVVCYLSGLKMLSLQSDLELNQGFILFSQMLSDDPKCHEAMFGLARINYIQGRYETAEKWLMKAYETKRDFAYRVWLGYTQLQLAMICLPENPKKLKFAQNAFSNLDRCAKERKVGLYANFGLLQLALDLSELQVKGLQDPSHYEEEIKTDYQIEGFEGPLAESLIQLKTGQFDRAFDSLLKLRNQGVSFAFFLLIRHHLQQKQYDLALKIAREADQRHEVFESSQERVAVIVLLAKCLKKNGQPEAAILTLQERYAELPHYSSLLYLYGKTIVQSEKKLHILYMHSGISALQEVQRVSCQVRSAKSALWLAEAYRQLNQSSNCGLQQLKYLASIIQVTKSGSIDQRLPENLIDARVQNIVLNQVSELKYSQDEVNKDPLFLSPQDAIPGQSLSVFAATAQEKDLVISCMKISEHRDQQLYKAITLYKLKNEHIKADNLFLNLLREYPDDVEIALENIKFVKSMMKLRIELRRGLSPQIEVQKLLDLIDRVYTDGNTWTNSLIECSKVYDLLSKNSDDFHFKLKAIECLLKIKQTLPVIDTKLAAVKIPESLNRYLFEEFDHIDFQSSSTQSAPVHQQQVIVESDDFKPQDDFDTTNQFFSQSEYTQSKLQTCPLATLSIAEIRDQTRVKGDTLFFFGAAQTELAYEAEANSVGKEETPDQQRKFYMSSTPLIVVIKFLQHLERLQHGTEYKEKVIDPTMVPDYGFCVYSDPQFLYRVAKLCFQYGIFIDLAVQSLYVYRQVMSYYRNFYDWNRQEIKAKLLLAMLLRKISSQPDLDKVVCDKIVQELSGPVKTAYDQVMFLPKAKLSKFEYDSIKQGKLLAELLNL